MSSDLEKNTEFRIKCADSWVEKWEALPADAEQLYVDRKRS